MAEEATELPMPLSEGGEDDIVVPVDPIVWDAVRNLIGPLAGIYQLKIRTFTGKEPVEPFIDIFNS